MGNVAKIEQPSQALTTQGGNAALLQVIERAASNPEVDIDKMERLMAMHERALERQAKAAYAEALAQMQDELPAIAERGKAIVNGAVRYTFSLWEDINTAIKPILKKHGFALSFRTDCSEGIEVTGVLSHKDGHSESTSIKLPADASGSKNAVQAVASSVSYGKRYTAGALLNLTSHGEDDDAYGALEPDADAAWYDAIDAATTMEELQKIAADLREASLTGRALRNVRAAWSAKSKEVSK